MTHEFIFVKQIIEEAKKQKDVVGITVEAGELGHVPPEEFFFSLEEAIKPYRWKLNKITKAAKAKCVCGFSGHPKVLERGHDHFMIECPKCGSIPKVVEGTDIKLVSVQVK